MSGNERVKTELRLTLARQPYEEKTRKVGQLVQLSSKMKAQRIHEEEPRLPARTLAMASRSKC